MQYERKISLHEHQQIMFRILCDFADFCDEHRLEYYLDAGTLLGAVRHQGFIPWDNDMDICMMRPDYDRFVELVKENNGFVTPDLLVEFPEDTIYPFIKVCDTRTVLIEFPEKYPIETAVYIDVFCKDGIKDKSFNSKIMCKISECLGLMYWFNKFTVYAWEKNGNRVQKLISLIGRHLIKNPIRPLRWQERLLDKNKRSNPFEKCKYVTTLTNGEYYRMAPKECFDERVLLQFNERKFYCPKGYDQWLRILYGDDYMTPPERPYTHNVKAYWK